MIKGRDPKLLVVVCLVIGVMFHIPKMVKTLPKMMEQRALVEEGVSSSSSSSCTTQATATSRTATSPFPAPPSMQELNAFIDNFVAANPQYQDACRAYLRSPEQYNSERKSFINWMWDFSQYNQDWFIFVNFLYQRHATMQEQGGLYVESGANHPLRVSNTAFFDHCLGWKGLCIEPLPRYHEALKKERTCELIPNCLSAVEGEEIHIDNNSQSASAAGLKVTCRRLENILKERNISHVDLWSLDVEGFEFNALSGIDWTGASGGSGIDIQYILMEQQEMTLGACEQMNIDFRLTTLGYSKYRIVSDAFYVKTPGGLRFADNGNNNHGPLDSAGSHVLDKYYRELEKPRCQKQNEGKEVKFFTEKKR